MLIVGYIFAGKTQIYYSNYLIFIIFITIVFIELLKNGGLVFSKKLHEHQNMII